MHIDSNEFKELLKKNGCKLTTQRRAVLNVLCEHSNEHLSTEEIYEYVKKKYPEIGLATVYRTVQLLEKINIIEKILLDDGCARYEMSRLSDNGHRHHHLICKKCGEIFEVEEDLLDDLEEQISNKYNFKIIDHKVKFYGYCSECMKKI